MRVSFLIFSLLCAVLSTCTPLTGPYPDWDPCPRSCESAGLDPSQWTQYHATEHLDYCNQTLIFDLSLYNPVNEPDSQFNLRACTASPQLKIDSPLSIPRLDVKIETAEIRLVSWGLEGNSTIDDVTAASQELQSFVEGSKPSESVIMLAKRGNAVVGVYIGSQVERKSAAEIIQSFIDSVSNLEMLPQRITAQICPDSHVIGSQIIGIFADAMGNVSSVQEALRSWNKAACVVDRALFEERMVVIDGLAIVSAIQEGNPSISERSLHDLTERVTCKYVLAGAGDGCWALAQKCGITQAKLESFNKAGLCTSTIQVGQAVCCASGTLPDFSPKPGADGLCATYAVKAGDICDTIASAHYITTALINQYNSNTWGWAGCGQIQIGMKICLSSGRRPFPAAVQGNVCGPQVPGTTRPANESAIWANLNMCPLNACCNIWGQCGITPEFCTKTTSETGNPGTAAPKTNGCISNCGTAIVNNAVRPSRFDQLGYFEAWNLERPCLNMDVSKLQGSKYDIIHFAFANITTSYQVDIGHVQEQFNGFLKLTGLARILSFGGWTFSTALDSYAIFRSSVTDANREKFANAVVAFAVDNNLDGLDFDWGYPGAPDIEGIPPPI